MNPWLVIAWVVGGILGTGLGVGVMYALGVFIFTPCESVSASWYVGGNEITIEQCKETAK